MSGNVPSRFRKGGALIQNPTERAVATTAGRAAVAQGPVHGADGTLEAIAFDSSATDAAKEVMRFAVHCWTCGCVGRGKGRGSPRPLLTLSCPPIAQGPRRVPHVRD